MGTNDARDLKGCRRKLGIERHHVGPLHADLLCDQDQIVGRLHGRDEPFWSRASMQASMYWSISAST
jgi:hypothetical protein